MNLQCPSCAANIEVGSNVPAGQLMRCSSCQTTFTTPSQAAPEAKAPEVKAGPAGPAFASAGPAAVTPPAPAGAAPAAGYGDGMLAPWEVQAMPAPPPAPPKPKDEDYGGGEALTGAAGQATDALAKMAGQIPIFGNLFKAIQPLLGAFGKLGGVIGQVAGGGSKAGGGGAGGGGGGGAGGFLTTVASRAGGFGAALGAAATVASAAVSALSGLTSAANALTAVYNPSLNQMLNRTYLDLQGTIGSGLTPVTQVAISSLRKFADAMVEPMRDLRPAVAGVAGAFGGLADRLGLLFADMVSALAPAIGVVGQLFGMFSSIIQLFVSLFQAMWSILAPLIGAVSAIFSGLLTPMQGAAGLFAELARAIAAVAAAVGDVIGSIFSSIGGAASGVGGVLKQVGGGLQYLFRALMTFGMQLAAYTAQFLGGTSALNAMIRSLEGPKEGGSVGMAAAQNAQVTSLSGLTNSLYAAAFTAQKVGPEGKKEDPMKDMVEALKSIRDGGGTTIAQAIQSCIDPLAKAIGDAVKGAASGAVEYVGGGVYNAGRSAYDSTVGAAGRYLFGE